MNTMDPNDLAKARQMEQIEKTKKKLLAKILSKEAYERLGRVRFANPELASQAELYILQVYQAGKLGGSVSDGQMREVLKALSEGKKDFKIKRQ